LVSVLERKGGMGVDEARTVMGRLIAAGIAQDRARRHLAAGSVRVDGQVVTDPAAAAPVPSRVVLLPS
jgi:hypothetical protein